MKLWAMLALYIVLLFGAIQLFEKHCSPFLARKLTHLGAGLVLLAVPQPLSLLSKVLITVFSAFVTWRAFEPLPRGYMPQSKSIAQRLDLGVSLFALVVCLTAWLGVDFRWQIPLFLGDPSAALVGRGVQRLKSRFGYQQKQPYGKSIIGSGAFLISAGVGIYSFWIDRTSSAWIIKWALTTFCAALISAVESLSMSFDNATVGFSGWCFAYTLPAWQEALRDHNSTRIAAYGAAIVLAHAFVILFTFALQRGLKISTSSKSEIASEDVSLLPPHM